MAYDNRNLFLTLLEARNPRSGCQDGWTRAFCVTDLLFPPLAGGTRELCRASLMKALIPFIEVQHHNLITAQRPDLILSPLGSRI